MKGGTALLVALCLNAAAATEERDYRALDTYLEEAHFTYRIESHERASMLMQQQAFEEELARLINSNPTEAIPRFVYYMVVDIGRYIHLDTPLGRSVHACIGDELYCGKFRKQYAYLTAHVYDWWLQYREDYPEYAPLENWLVSEFAREAAIPAYKRQLEKEAERRRKS